MSVTTTTTLWKAVEILSQVNALCAPVYEELASGERQFVGVLDVVGIIFYLLDSLEKELSEAHGAVDNDRPGSFAGWLSESKALRTLVVKDIIDSPRWLPFVCIEETAMLSDAMALLGRERFHRVLVASDKNVKNIITQSSVIKFIFDHHEDFASVTSKTLEELGVTAPKPVVSISIDDCVVSAFRAMKDNHVSGVPLLDENGAVVGCISDRHIRSVLLKGSSRRPLHQILAMSATEFLASLPPDHARHGDMHPAIICKASDKLGDIIKKLAASRIHRIFLVDEHHKPIRVISLCDIIELLLAAEEQVEHALVA